MRTILVLSVSLNICAAPAHPAHDANQNGTLNTRNYFHIPSSA